MSSNLVSFTCGACEATLSIAVEQAGVSGPCPYCGTHVSSPRVDRLPAPELQPVELEEREPEPTESRPWFQSQLMSAEETVLPVRRCRTGWLVAAGFAMFAGGVAALW